MAQVSLDECLNPALRTKIKKLVELNLDSDSIWDLLDPNLKTYEDDMYNEVEKYVKYVLWLRETKRSLDNAYEKYKNYTQNITRTFKRDLANRLELEQKRKDQQRIDELSALMKFSRRQKHRPKQETDPELATTDSNESEETLSSKPILEFINEKETDGRKKSETNDETNEGESTESDLDFIDLATNQEPNPLTATTKDMLFETMSATSSADSGITIEATSETETPEEKQDEKTLATQASNDGTKTNDALAFYHQLEDKYGQATTETPLATYELGSKIKYHNEHYIIVKTEMVKDYFNKYEVVLTLKNLATKTTLRVNRKQIELEN